MSATAFCIARHGENGKDAGYRKLGSLHVDLDPVPALDAAPRQIQILRKSSLPLSPSLAGDKQPLPPQITAPDAE